MGDDTLDPQNEIDAQQARYVRRLEDVFLDASRFIPTDRTIELNADTNRIVLEVFQRVKKRELDKELRKN